MHGTDARSAVATALLLLFCGGCGEGPSAPQDPGFDTDPAAAAVEGLAGSLAGLDEAWLALDRAAALFEESAIHDLLPGPRGRLVPDTAADRNGWASRWSTTWRARRPGS